MTFYVNAKHQQLYLVYGWALLVAIKLKKNYREVQCERVGLNVIRMSKQLLHGNRRMGEHQMKNCNWKTIRWLLTNYKSVTSLCLLFVAFISPHFPSSFIFTSFPSHGKRTRGALKLLSGSGRSLATKRHLVNLRLKECFWWGQF